MLDGNVPSNRTTYAVVRELEKVDSSDETTSAVDEYAGLYLVFATVRWSVVSNCKVCKGLFISGVRRGLMNTI